MVSTDLQADEKLHGATHTIPQSSTNTRDGRSEKEEPLVAVRRVAVETSPVEGKADAAENQRRPESELVHEGTTDLCVVEKSAMRAEELAAVRTMQNRNNMTSAQKPWSDISFTTESVSVDSQVRHAAKLAVKGV